MEQETVWAPREVVCWTELEFVSTALVLCSHLSTISKGVRKKICVFFPLFF